MNCGEKHFTKHAKSGMRYVDQSGKKRIEIVPQNLNVEMVPVLHSEPIRQTDSDHEFEAASGDEGEVLCDKQQPMREW